MKCPFCEAIIQDDALFCTNCGKKLPESMTMKAQTAPEPAAAEAEPAPAVQEDIFVPDVSVSAEKDDEIISRMRTHLDDRRRELSNALTDCRKLAAGLSELTAKYDALKEETGGFSEKMDELTRALEEKEAELARVKAELDGAQRLIGQQEQEKRQLTDRIAELTAAAAAATAVQQAGTEPVQAAETEELVADEKTAEEEVSSEALVQSAQPVVRPASEESQDEAPEEAPEEVTEKASEEAPAGLASEAEAAEAKEVPASESAECDHDSDDDDDIEIPDDDNEEIEEPTQTQVIGAYSSEDEKKAFSRPVPPIAPAVQKCPNCGSLMPPENKFCTNCGTRLR